MAFNKKRKEDKYEENKGFGNSKILAVFEWIWRIFVLNTLTLVCTLGIITIVPSLVACFRTIKACYEEDETHYVKAYFKNFVYCFKDTVGLSVFMIIMLGMLGYAYIFYSGGIDALAEEGNHKGWLNIYSVLLGLDAVFFIVLFFIAAHFPMVCTYFHFRFFDKIKFSFYMATRHAVLSLFLLLVFIASTALFLFLPYYIFVGYFSIQSLLWFLLSRRAYYMTSQRMQFVDDQADEYDRQGKQVNRETYEDEEEDKIKAEGIENLKKINREIESGETNGKTRN